MNHNVPVLKVLHKSGKVLATGILTSNSNKSRLLTCSWDCKETSKQLWNQWYLLYQIYPIYAGLRCFCIFNNCNSRTCQVDKTSLEWNYGISAGGLILRCFLILPEVSWKSGGEVLQVLPTIDWKTHKERERENERMLRKPVRNNCETCLQTYDQTNASTTNRLRPKFCCLVGQWCVGVAGVWETSSKTLFGLEPLHTRRLQQQVQHSRQPSSATGDCQSSPLGAPWLRIFQRPWNSSDGPMRGLYISGESKKNLCRHRHFSSKLAIEESLRASDFSDTLFHTFLSDLIWNCPALWMEPWHLCLNFWMTNYRTCRWHIFLILWICSHLLWRSFPITCNELFLYWTVLVLKYSFAELFSQVNFLDKWLHSDRLFGHGYTSWWMSFGSPSEMGPGIIVFVPLILEELEDRRRRRKVSETLSYQMFFVYLCAMWDDDVYMMCILYIDKSFNYNWLQIYRLFDHRYSPGWTYFGSRSEMGPWHHSLRPIDPGRTWR